MHVGDMYGVALAALGMLSNLATCLAIDVYGPICDNAVRRRKSAKQQPRPPRLQR